MVAATGHRICNDCMKSCIYQKQEPVDIPQAETRTLKDVLELPWGFEIYSLLTRWNPLNLRRPLPRPRTGKRVLVVGHGAGGLHARASPDERRPHRGRHRRAEDRAAPRGARRASTPRGERVPFEPIRDVRELYEPLDDRVMAGFGGVAEYGITVRWDKNFLKMIRLLLERRAAVRAVRRRALRRHARPLEDAFALGFDHVALAHGRGQPTVLDMPNGLARGVRTASDFLMALQLTGAAKADSHREHAGAAAGRRDRRRPDRDRHRDRVARLLPGAGREVPARYETLAARARRGRGRAIAGPTRSARSPTSSSRTRARSAPSARGGGARRRAPRIVELLQRWGGVTIAYRRRLIDSPSYTLNHEEVREGARGRHPFRRRPDAARASRSTSTATRGRIRCREAATRRGRQVARVRRGRAAGARRSSSPPARSRTRCSRARTPRTSRSTASTSSALRRGRATRSSPQCAIAKPATCRRAARRAAPMAAACSFFGDLHPSFFGNVVKAMGSSASRAIPIVSPRAREACAGGVARPTRSSSRSSTDELRATVHEVERLTPTIVEVVVRAPLPRAASSPGQFYRLQNFETLAHGRRGHAARDGRPRAHRRVGRSRAGARLDDRARDGRLVRSVRAAAARRAGRADGADRHADRDRAGRDRRARRRRPRQRGAVLDRPGVPRRRLARALLRRLQEDRSTATRSRRSRRPPTSWSGAATRRRVSRPARPQDSAFVGNIVQAMRGVRERGVWAPSRFRSRTRTASSRSARTG